MAYRTLTEAAVHFSNVEGRHISRRQVLRWLQLGYFKDVKKIEWGENQKGGVWFVGDDRAPSMDTTPIPRRQPPGPRQRSQTPNAVVRGFKR